MKNFNKILVAFAILVGLNATAQDSKNKWAISFGVNALDTKTSAGGGKNFFDNHLSQPFSVKDNWNILPSISYVGVSRYVGDNFSVGISGSLNKMSKYVTAVNSGFKVANPGDLMYYGIEGFVKYSFKTIIKSEKIDPSVTFGLGYSALGDNTYQTVSPGVGVVYWASNKVGFEISSKYVKSFEARELKAVVNAPSMLQHSFGLVFKFGSEE